MTSKPAAQGAVNTAGGGPGGKPQGPLPPLLLATRLLPWHGSVAVAGSTLAAAALFAPLRSRVQRMVDRRFNRARNDADETVAAFAAA